MKGEVGDWMRGRFALSLMTYYDLHCGWFSSLLVKAIIILNSVAVLLARTMQLPFSRPGRDQCRSGQRQHLYLLRSAVETYLFHRSVPLTPSLQRMPVVESNALRDGE